MSDNISSAINESRRRPLLSFELSVNSSTWIFSGVILCLGLLGSWLLTFANKTFYEKDIGASYEARKNPFLAAQYFLQKNNTEASFDQSFSRLDKPLDPNSSIIISNSRKPLSKARIENLKYFVQQGGHLILKATEFYDDERRTSDAPILQSLGVRLYPFQGWISQHKDDEPNEHSTHDGTDNNDNDYNDTDFNDTDSNNDKPNDSEVSYYETSYDNTTYLNIDPDQPATEIVFNHASTLMDTSGNAVWIAGSDNATHLLRYAMGDGFITVLSDMSIWQNNRIDQVDHALFLHQLTQSSPSVIIIYNPQFDSLLSLLWQHGYYVVIALGVLMLMLIWHFQVKTGPVFAQFSNQNRQLLQHIRAAAEFKWQQYGKQYGQQTGQQKNGQQLLNNTRHTVLKAIQRKHRGFSNYSEEKQLSLLQQHSALDRQQLQLALLTEPKDQKQFTQCIRSLQLLRQKLYGQRL